MSAKPHNLPGTNVWALLAEPLVFLSRCAESDRRVLPLRAPFLDAYVLMDPSDIEQVLVTNNERYVKPLWLRTRSVKRLLGDGLVTSDATAWRDQRSVCQPAFQPRQMDGYAATISDVTHRAVGSWHPGERFDLQRAMTAITMEILTRTMFGDEAARERDEIGDIMETLILAFSVRRLPLGLIPWPPSRRERRAVERLDRLVDKIVARSSAQPGSQTLLSLVQGSVAGCPAAPGQRAVREQAKTFLAAGHESSALALTWAFVLLAQNPQAENRLRDEVMATLGERAPTAADVARMPYLNAVIKETLRLYPPLWITGRQAVGRQQIGELSVPNGALVITSQWAVHRSPRLFPEPLAFQAERWLTDESRTLPRFAYFPFGGGARSCIGQRFAQIEMGIVLAAVMQRWHLAVEAAEAVTPWATMTLRPKERVTATAR